MLCAAIVVAAGRGRRAGEGLPKQYRAVDGEIVLRRTLRRLCAHPDVAAIQVVIHPDDAALYEQASAGLPRLRPPVAGGRALGPYYFVSEYRQ